MRRIFILAAAILLVASCGKDATAPRVQIQFSASNTTSDTLIVWWWWKDVRSEDLPGDPVVLPPGSGATPCITFTAVGWAQIDAAEGTHDRNSSAGDWRGNLVTIDPARASYWRIAASGILGVPPTVTEESISPC